ncbi:MAG: magnesium transporter, partial [Pyramidobacter sp.]|nr:magnesium transporter [Pyramidobacter sp.]
MSLDEKKLLWEVETCIQQKRFREAKELLSDMEPIDIAEGLEDLPSAQLVLYFRLLPKDLAVEVFEMLDFDEQERFLAHATGDEVTEIIEEMSDDDRTELFDELPATTVKRLLLKLSPEERRLANTLLGYPEDSAGRIMTPEYIALKAHMTVKSALERIREKARSKETIYTSFVTDEGRHLLGAVELEDLILADPDAEVIDIMNGDPVSVATSADQEQAAQIISRYDLHTLPVVDSEKRLVGIITFDDVLDVVEEEATEDIERMAGIEPVEEDYLDANLFTVARKRFVWLVICIITEALTSTVLKHYSPLTQHVVSLTFFVPLLIGTGGNAGTQA